MQNKTHITIDEVHFGTHFEEQLFNRFKMTMSEFGKHLQYCKRGNINSPFSQVRQKLSNYNHQAVFYNQRFNLMFTVDTISKTACTAMFLTGEDYKY